MSAADISHKVQNLTTFLVTFLGNSTAAFLLSGSDILKRSEGGPVSRVGDGGGERVTI